MRYSMLTLMAMIGIVSTATAQLPPQPQWADWSMRVTADQPGEMSAADLLDKPAGRHGPIVCRDGHFYSGDTRVRFWGVNIAFGANFPTHAEADALALRFASYGINAVRFHHMDNQRFPNGIFADASLTALSPEALDRLDYFIADLKQRGIYADLNLHVSRNYNHYHKTADGRDGPRADKIVDLFDPELIDAQKQYARDLLRHVNAYTHARYADEPAVGIVEINNENSLFMWGADKTLGALPDVYRDELQRQWNRWVAAKYPARQQLQSAWDAGSEKLGDSLLRDGKWVVETHENSAMHAMFGNDGPSSADVTVTAVDGTDWHLQLNQPGLNLEKNRRYTVSFDASTDRPCVISVGVSQSHSPWESLGLSSDAQLDKDKQSFSMTFSASATDDNARLSFILGRQSGEIQLSAIKLAPGGGTGLAADEDPATGSVRTPSAKFSPTTARRDDWYTFLQETEEGYYVGMLNFLRTDLGVKCPITGTIGFGPMGTFTQANMDFVDAHAYWQHPSFPHRQWDISDWVIGNTPMVDQPERGTFWSLAGTRVAGKPFTVTEYQHPAPSDWQAECIPMIATFAGLQDWDGVFLFAYSHNSDYDKDKISSFFDIEGNPTKMPLMPMGARLFAAVQPDAAATNVTPLSYDQLLRGVPQYSGDQAVFLTQVAGFDPRLHLNEPIAISFDGKQERATSSARAKWTAHGPGTGRFALADPNAAVFVGFSHDSMPIDLGDVRIESLSTPFATVIVTPATPGQKISETDRLLLTAIARAQNTGMGWTADHRSVGNQWGRAPVQIEVVQARVSLPGRWKDAKALDADGKPTGEELAEIQGDRTVVRLGSSPALCYEVTR